MTDKPYWKEYYDNNREKRLEQSKKSYEKRREKVLAKQKAEREKIKQWAVDYLGGKCHNCSMEYPLAVYDFHHLDPTEKEFSPAALLQIKDKDKIKKEIDKCILLCANCHRIEHYNKD